MLSSKNLTEQTMCGLLRFMLCYDMLCYSVLADRQKVVFAPGQAIPAPQALYQSSLRAVGTRTNDPCIVIIESAGVETAIVVIKPYLLTVRLRIAQTAEAKPPRLVFVHLCGIFDIGQPGRQIIGHEICAV